MKKVIKCFKMSKGIFNLMNSITELPYYIQVFISEFKNNFNDYEKACSDLSDAQH